MGCISLVSGICILIIYIRCGEFMKRKKNNSENLEEKLNFRDKKRQITQKGKFFNSE